MHWIGQELTLLWYTTDSDGNAQDADATPEVTVTCNGATVASSTTDEGVGEYRTVFTPTQAGRHVGHFSCEVDGAADVSMQVRVVHDPEAEGASQSFPDGISSWESAVF